MIKQLAISLTNTKVNNLIITQNDNECPVKDLKLSFKNYFNKSEDKTFRLVFEIIVPHKEGLIFNVEYEAIFITNEPIDENFMISPFTKINAPAIAFPFLRAYISTLMTLSGYSPLILPTINFSENISEDKTEIDIDK